MKKLLLLAGLAVAAISCSNDETMVVNPQMPEMPAMRTAASIRSIDEAAQIASDAIGMLPTSGSRSAGRTFDKKNVKFGVNAGSRAGNDTLMYVFNFDNNEGFAVVAANRNVDGLIAVTELGSYDPNSTPENPGLAMYMKNVKEELAELSVEAELDTLQLIIDPTKPNYPPGLMEYKTQRDTVYYEEVLPNFNMRWGQSMPEGAECPNGIAGCANLSLFMIMAYLEYPSSITLSYLNATMPINIDWTAIKRHHQSYLYSYELQADDCLDKIQHDYIARICRELGHRNNSDYSNPGATSTNPENVRQTAIDLGFNVSEMRGCDNALTALTNNGIIFASGADVNDTGVDSSHAFIIDGFRYFDIHSAEWTRPAGTIEWHMINDHGTQSYRFLHINWGWRGNDNGYFSSGIYNTSSPAYPDTPNNTITHNYTQFLRFFTVSKNN